MTALRGVKKGTTYANLKSDCVGERKQDSRFIVRGEVPPNYRQEYSDKFQDVFVKLNRNSPSFCPSNFGGGRRAGGFEPSGWYSSTSRDKNNSHSIKNL